MAAMNNMINNNAMHNAEDGVFVNMGEGGPRAPDDVVHVRVHPSVTIIHAEAFKEREKLEEVELHEGLLEIGSDAFSHCISLEKMIIPSTVTLIGDYAFLYCEKLEKIELQEGSQEIGGHAFNGCKSLKRVNIPSTIKRIGGSAFSWTSLSSIDLPDSLESIGSYSFFACKFNQFRIPPNITSLPEAVLCHNQRLFSVEIPPEGITQIEWRAFQCCSSLRNIAFPPNVETREDVFGECNDLHQLFGTEEEIIQALKHRFDNLPLHKMLYYQSFQHLTSDQLTNATNIRSGQRRELQSTLDTTGNQQDCLGMTPLHILACSTVQDLGLYKVLLEKYPGNLIVEDRWGALSLFYAVLGNHSSSDIVQFLVECYHSLYPNYEPDWTKMIATLAKADAPKETIQNLVGVQQEYFPNQSIDWSTILDNNSLDATLFWQETFASLVEFSISRRAKAIGVKYWRDELTNIEYTESHDMFVIRDVREQGRRVFRAEVEAKLVKYETEYHNLKEATTTLELALWKNKMTDFGSHEGNQLKVDESNVRHQYRVSCGADIAIQHVLQYLLPFRLVALEI